MQNFIECACRSPSGASQQKPEAQWWFATPILPSLKTIPASQVQDGKVYLGESMRLQGELLQAVGQKHVKSLRIPLRSIEGYPLKALDRRDAGFMTRC